MQRSVQICSVQTEKGRAMAEAEAWVMIPKLDEKKTGCVLEMKPLVLCKDCKHWDKTTREEGNNCISGPWEDAVCDIFRDWDSYGDLGENFRRTNGDWFCADGERR